MPKMVIRIDSEKCTGCGTCIDACAFGAIHMVVHLAEVDDTLCTVCEACIGACANSALSVVSMPVFTASITKNLETEPVNNLNQPGVKVLKPTLPVPASTPLVGTIFTLLGSQVAPRLIDLLFKTLENRLTQPKTNRLSASIPTAINYPLKRGRRKQVRQRGGFMGYR
jgi:NAD-dependent dihydropyrimidine dehydrogenase PreA subunit